MHPIKLVPMPKDYLWGGQRLKAEYGIDTDMDKVAEAWVLSPEPGAPSVIASGEYKGQTLEALLREGERLEDVFPLTVKFIDAMKPLSIQVHPNDEYAQEHYQVRGKTECWYVLDAEPGAYLYYGFSRPVNKEEVRSRIEDGSLISILNKIEVRKDDVFLIKSGTLHAIGPGVLVAEVQQCSPLTFRVFDYKRVDKNGKERELHVDEALACMSLNCNLPKDRPALLKSGDGYQIYSMVNCKYFSANIYRISKSVKIRGNEAKWRGLLVTEGQITITNSGDEGSISGKKGEFFLIPREDKEFIIEGEADFILID